MEAWCWKGRQFEPCDSLPVSDRGFRYGMSVFETVRLWRSQPLFLAEHLALLTQACGRLGFSVDPAALAAVESLLKQQADGVARLYVTAGDGPLDSRDFSAPRILVLCEKRPPPVEKPCRLTIVDTMYKAPFGGLKTANYWANADALAHALEGGHDEALLFNENSELVSAASANVFVVRGGEIRTPALECGARAGVTRSWIMSRLPVSEGSLFVGDLQAADEVFLSSSWYGVRPATSVMTRDLPQHQVGDRLAAEFREAIGA